MQRVLSRRFGFRLSPHKNGLQRCRGERPLIWLLARFEQTTGLARPVQSDPSSASSGSVSYQRARPPARCSLRPLAGGDRPSCVLRCASCAGSRRLRAAFFHLLPTWRCRLFGREIAVGKKRGGDEDFCNHKNTKDAHPRRACEQQDTEGYCILPGSNVPSEAGLGIAEGAMLSCLLSPSHFPTACSLFSILVQSCLPSIAGVPLAPSFPSFPCSKCGVPSVQNAFQLPPRMFAWPSFLLLAEAKFSHRPAIPELDARTFCTRAQL